MTTQQVANRLVELCRQGRIMETQQELYADDVTSTETGNTSVKEAKGMQAIVEKSKMFQSMVEEFHGSEISDPVIADDHFAISWMMDVTMKDKGRMKMQEICVYKVKDGKVVSEQFFFSM
jgi:ketosteroid isomerase-like protein